MPEECSFIPLSEKKPLTKGMVIVVLPREGRAGYYAGPSLVDTFKPRAGKVTVNANSLSIVDYGVLKVLHPNALVTNWDEGERAVVCEILEWAYEPEKGKIVAFSLSSTCYFWNCHQVYVVI